MFTPGMEMSRETLSEHLTGLKSLLRLNADGIGDDEDLATQLNRTRLAIDVFESDLLGHRHIIRGDVITPDTLPPSSRSSAVADEDLDGEDGVPYFSRPTTASSMTSARFSLDSLPSSWKNSPNRLLSPRDSLSKKPYAYVEDVNEEDEEGQEEGEEETIQNDVAFQRLSMLLAGLQAQAEAAVSSPSKSLQPPGALDPSFEEEEAEEMPFPRLSRSASSSMLNNGMNFNASGPGTPRLTSFHRATTSLPFIGPRPFRRSSRLFNEDNSAGSSTVPSSPRKPRSPMVPPSPISRTSTSTSLPTFELPPTPPPTLRKRPTGLDLSPPKSGVFSTLSSPALLPKSGIASALASPGLLARRGSYLVTDTDLETLLNEFLEVTQVRNRDSSYDVMFGWVWMCLFGGGVVWAVVGLMLGWGCMARSCVAPSS